MLFANVILGLRSLVGKLNPVSLSVAHSKVEKWICKLLEPSFNPWWDWKSHDFWSCVCCHFLPLGLSLLIWVNWDWAWQSPWFLSTQGKILRLEIIQITWYPEFPLSGIFSYESYFTRWRKERKWRARTLSKKKKVKADVVSWSHLSRKVQPFFKNPQHRYPATCHWLTGADQSESYSCSFNLTWEIKKAEGTRDEYTRHQAVILGQNKAEKTQGSLQIIFTLATILGDLRWGPSTSLPLCKAVFHGVSFPYMRNRDKLSAFELHKLLKFPFCSLFKLVIYLACRIILKPYVFKREVCCCWSLMGMVSNSIAFP